MPVRGWLLLLCILLTLWNPATLAVVAASRLGSATLSWTAALTLLIRLAVTSVGVAAGMALWSRRVGAVEMAKLALALSAIEAAARLATRFGLSDAPPGVRLPLTAALVLFNTAWYLYLGRSRRVRATYDLKSRPGIGRTD